MNATDPANRDLALGSEQSALLFIDVQNYCARRDGGEFSGISEDELDRKYGYYFDRLETLAIPNMQRLQAAFREKGVEVLYTTIECLTIDGRDRSMAYKIAGFHVPKGSWDGKVIDELAPADDEIWLSKSTSNVFISTNIDYVLRNLGIRQLVICGVVTDQCVEAAVRHACNLGYAVTLVPDACAAYSQQRHDNSLSVIGKFCRQLTTQELLDEIAALSAAPMRNRSGGCG